METRSRQMRCTNVTVRFCITQRRLHANSRYPSEWRRLGTDRAQKSGDSLYANMLDG